jgi:hypothetical protein
MALIHNAVRTGKVRSLPVLAGKDGNLISLLFEAFRPVLGHCVGAAFRRPEQHAVTDWCFSRGVRYA